MGKRGPARLYPRAYLSESAVAGYGLGLAAGAEPDSVKLPAADGDEVLAVSLRSADAGENITVQPLIPGIEVEVVAGAVIAKDALISALDTGRWHTPAGASGETQQLQALEAATADGEVITARVLVDPVVA